MDVNTRYTLDEVQNNIASLESVSQITGNNNNADITNSQPTCNLKGTGKGSYTIDMQTGLLMNEKSSFSVKGNIQVNGTDVPVIIVSKKEVTSRKV